ACLERTAAGKRVRLVGDSAARERLTMHAVALVVVHRRDRRVDRYLVKIRSAEPADLRVDVGMQPAGEERIVGEIDSRDDMRNAERNLLGLREKVVGIAIEHHAPERLNGYE